MKMRTTVSDKNTEQHPVNNQGERNTSTLTPKSRKKKKDLKTTWTAIVKCSQKNSEKVRNDKRSNS